MVTAEVRNPIYECSDGYHGSMTSNKELVKKKNKNKKNKKKAKIWPLIDLLASPQVKILVKYNTWVKGHLGMEFQLPVALNKDGILATLTVVSLGLMLDYQRGPWWAITVTT